MEKNLLRILIFDSASVILALILFLYGPMGEKSFFYVSSWVIFACLSVSFGLTLLYILKNRERSNLTIIFFILLVSGVVISFFNWFAGGLIALLSLPFLLFSKNIRGEIEIAITYSGFFILALLPPLETYLRINPSFLDYIIIGAGFALIVAGLVLAYRRVELSLMLGFILLALSFFLIAPFHEIFHIHYNGIFGVYDSSIIILAALTFFVFLFSILEYDRKSIQLQEEIRKGYEYLTKGKYKKAEGIFRILYKKKRDKDVLNGLSIALMREGKLDESERILKKLVSRYPEETYLLNLGNLYYRKGNKREAMLLYSKILKNNPECYNALNNLARCYMDLGEYENAEKLLKRAIEISPEKKVAQINYKELKEKMASEN